MDIGRSAMFLSASLLVLVLQGVVRELMAACERLVCENRQVKNDFRVTHLGRMSNLWG